MFSRKGLGRGSGKRGYYNLAPLDSHIHSLSAKGIKISDYSLKHFNVDKDNILKSKDKYNGENVFSVMYNPDTQELLVGDKTSHSDMLRARDVELKDNSKFDEWVRAKYDSEKNVLFVRHYFNPVSKYAEFDSHAFDLSEKMQKKIVDALVEEGMPKDIKVKYNQTNETLRDEGYLHS